MNVQQKIKRDILLKAIEDYPDIFLKHPITKSITGIVVDTLYDADDYEDNGVYCSIAHFDFEDEFRSEYTEETKVPTEPAQHSRYYEVKSVVKKLSCGTLVGYPYYYGGGEYGNPGAINWISMAYELSVEEYQETVTIRKFTKKEVN